MAYPSLFTKSNNDVFVALTVYVDDLILASNYEKEIKNIKSYLHKCFSIKDLGMLKYIRGLEVVRNKEGIHLYQQKYTLDLLAEYGFISSKQVSTPITVGTIAYIKTRKLQDNTNYRKLIGKLLYITNTNLDIAYVVQQLSQHLKNPHEAHLTAAHRILRYLKGKPALWVFYSSTKDYKIKCYTDYD